MARSSALIAIALMALPSVASGSGSAPAGKASPPIVPYLCDDGHTANVIYRSGSGFRHARAIVSHAGRTFDLPAAPTLYGVRYRGEAADGASLAWSLRGEEAVLSEAPEPDSYARTERELLRCVRVRGALVAGAHGSDRH